MSSLRPRSLSEYAGMFWRRKMLIAVTAAVVLMAAMIAIRRLPSIYEARALIVVSGMRGEEGRQAAAASITLITKQLESRATLAPIIKRHGLYQGLSSDGQVGQMLRSLKINTQLRGYYPESPEAVIITFRHHDPAVAQRVLSDVATFFTHTNEVVSRQAAEQAREIEAKIAEIESHIRKLGARPGGQRGPYDLAALRAERLAAGSTIESLEDRQYALERQLAEQRRQIAEQQKLVQIAPPTSFSGAHGALLVRKAELEAQLKDYATQYTDKNPKVAQARHQIAEINRQLAQISAGGEMPVAGTPEGRELRALERDLARMETEMEITRRALGRRKQSLSALPNLKPGAAAAAAAAEMGGAVGGSAEIGFLQNRYVALLDQQDGLRLALAAPIERGLAPFRLIDPPTSPQSPVSPDRNRLMLMALCVALAIGLAAAVVIEGPRLRLIRTQRDAEYYLGAPVVALIPETLTPAERGARRRMMVTRRLALLGLAVAATPLLAALLLYFGILHKIAFR